MEQAGLAIDDPEAYFPGTSAEAFLACDLGLFIGADYAMLAEAAAI